jgi:hypothetical protein
MRLGRGLPRGAPTTSARKAHEDVQHLGPLVYILRPKVSLQFLLRLGGSEKLGDRPVPTPRLYRRAIAAKEKAPRSSDERTVSVHQAW